MTKRTDYYSAESLDRASRKLVKQAMRSALGIAPENLEKYPGYYTMLTARTRSGAAEFHQHDADFFIVVDGESTLVAGGKLEGARVTGEGERQGTSISGGQRQKLRKGDIVHIPPNTPHQLLLSPGRTFTYFVIKVRE